MLVPVGLPRSASNLDETLLTAHPSLDERTSLMKPQIRRLRADIACCQEVHGQERPGQPRDLLALRKLLTGTNLDSAPLVSGKPEDDAVSDLRNLIIANPPDPQPVAICIERPVLHAQIDIDHAEPRRLLNIITVHLKSKIPSDIPGQVISTQKGDIWLTADSFE
ncbi:hypothetical protein [Streptomyces sp. NBC_01565]|uniref:hypothetical protein n=1 Tax=unclassified Streptomyces TaxID=2593676 RepID=UPI00225A1BD3|nr:hypothetical protein [Streptomyces sp. NBC_01565]MCX4547008.1 hypothetical protein [Streptomyces sp. NBC_01565]